MQRTEVIQHVSGMKIKIELHDEELSAEDKAFISTFQDSIYCNDLTAQLWMFDQQMPSGRWLENIHPANDLRTAVAYVA
jgi:hypothetical protein